MLLTAGDGRRIDVRPYDTGPDEWGRGNARSASSPPWPGPDRTGVTDRGRRRLIGSTLAASASSPAAGLALRAGAPDDRQPAPMSSPARTGTASTLPAGASGQAQAGS